MVARLDVVCTNKLPQTAVNRPITNKYFVTVILSHPFRKLPANANLFHCANAVKRNQFIKSTLT